MAGKVKLGTFDLSPAILQAIADGKMDLAIDPQQYLQGYMPVDFLAELAQVRDHAGRRLSDRPGLRHQGQGRLGGRPVGAGQSLSPLAAARGRCAADPVPDLAQEHRWRTPFPRQPWSSLRHGARRAPEADAARSASCAGPSSALSAGLVLVILFFALHRRSAACSRARASINFLELGSQLGILAIAAALLMIAGEFDLSIGSMIGFAGLVIAIPACAWGWPLLARDPARLRRRGGRRLRSTACSWCAPAALLHRHARLPVHAARTDALGLTG